MMRSPEEILATARAKYRSSWRDWLLYAPKVELSFPLAAPSAQEIVRESDAVGMWVKEWRGWRLANPVAQLRRATRRTIVGDQEIFTHLDLTTVDDLVTLDQEMSKHWQQANERWADIHNLPGSVVVARLRPWLSQIVTLDEADFDILLKAVIWFGENPRSGLTIRQVPVAGMHTKWLAHHRRLVLACLNIIDQKAEESNDLDDRELEQDDVDALGLRALPVHIDVIIADPDYRTRVGGLRHLSAPLPEITALPIQPTVVVIVENKESAYILPDWPRTIIIHSLGNHLNVLDQIGWLDAACQFYWGDIDRAGIALLSRARMRLPRIVSVLMDTETLQHHLSLSNIDTSRADAPEPNLFPEERATLAALTTSNGDFLRLEQERISEAFLLERFERSMESMNG